MMDNGKVPFYEGKVDYLILVLGLFLIVILGYRNQLISFGVPLVISGYFIGKNLLILKELKILIPFVLLILIGSQIRTGHHVIHILRDYAYFLSPLTAFTMGYLLKKHMSLNKFMLLIILFGTLYSLAYLLQITFSFDTLFVEDTEDTRYTVGTGLPAPILAIIFIFLGQDYLKQFKIATLYLFLFVFVNLVAIYYFASRVYYFTLFLYFVPLLYNKFISKYKIVGVYIFGIILIVITGAIIIMLSGDNFLAEKMRNSITEMFIQSFEDYESVIHNWRAYELYEAIKTFMNGGVFNKLFGFGFGKTVYLEYEMIMSLLTISEIPIFHNGFAYILIKTGVLGIVFELYFTVSLLYHGYLYTKNRDDLKFAFYLLLSTVLSFNFSTLVVNGLFSGESCVLLILSGFIYSLLKEKYEEVHNEEN